MVQTPWVFLFSAIYLSKKKLSESSKKSPINANLERTIKMKLTHSCTILIPFGLCNVMYCMISVFPQEKKKNLKSGKKTILSISTFCVNPFTVLIHVPTCKAMFIIHFLC